MLTPDGMRMAIKSSWKKTLTFIALLVDVPDVWVMELGWRFMGGAPLA